MKIKQLKTPSLITSYGSFHKFLEDNEIYVAKELAIENFKVIREQEGTFILEIDETDILVVKKDINVFSMNIIEEQNQSFQFLGQHFASFMHDLAVPINVLNTSAEMLSFCEGEKESDELIEKIQGASQIIVDMIHSTKTIYKGDPNQISAFSAKEVAIAAVSLMDLESAKHNIDIDAEICDVVLHSKKSVITRILSNLIKNSIEALYNVEHSRKWIEIKTALKDGMISFYVIDGGDGVSKEKEATLFEMSTTKNNGTGMGLFKAKKEAKKLQGDLYYHRKDNRTIFQLKIPIQIK